MNFHRNSGRFCVSELHEIRLSRSLRSLRFGRNKVYGPVRARNWYKCETKSIYIIDKNLHRRRDQLLSSNGIHRHTRNLISKGNGNSLELHRSKLVRSVLIIKQSHTARYILFPPNKSQFRITVVNQSGFAKITYFVGGRAFYRWKKERLETIFSNVAENGLSICLAKQALLYRIPPRRNQFKWN